MVVRYLIEGGERATDVRGTLAQRTDSSLIVNGPSGPVEIPRTAIVAGKTIPPPPQRRRRKAD
ncbi:hypothetical protein BH23ACT6_BH23ACT6_17740 [soil metagenome]